MTNNEKALAMHEQWNGKLETVSKSPVNSREALAIGSADILQVDAAEARGKPGDGLYDLFRILGIQADGDGVDATELFKQHGLAFHHRHGCMGADVSEPKYGASVGDHGNEMPFFTLILL